MVQRKKWLLLLLMMVLAGCSGLAPTVLPLATSASTPTAISIEKPELSDFFQGFDGAFVLYDRNQNLFIRYNPQRCAERFLPASTFKILNALIGLETGVIPDEDYVIHWDGTQYPSAIWNQDHTLKTAIQNSVVWYFQELARRVGRERMLQYIRVVGYGNQDLSGPIDSFWLDGTLQISADEQVAFLRRLYQNDLPFSERSMTIVRNIIVLDQNETYRLSGKTGSGQVGGMNTGWFVGAIENQDNVYFFATNISSANQQMPGNSARDITYKILQDLGLLPE